MMKRGQEEMVGFVLIVVIVAVALLVFLTFSFSNDSESSVFESREVYQFLESAMEYTSECAISYEPAYSKVGDLIRDCYDRKRCVNGKEACIVLNETLDVLLNGAFSVGEDRPIKAYVFSSVYETDEREEKIFGLERGNCTASVRGSEITSSAYPGTIASSLQLCY